MPHVVAPTLPFLRSFFLFRDHGGSDNEICTRTHTYAHTPTPAHMRGQTISAERPLYAVKCNATCECARTRARTPFLPKAVCKSEPERHPAPSGLPIRSTYSRNFPFTRCDRGNKARCRDTQTQKGHTEKVSVSQYQYSQYRTPIYYRLHSAASAVL